MSNERLEKLFSFLQSNPDDPFILYAIAGEYVKLNDTDQAIAYYNALTDRFPDYVGTYYHFGKLYEALQQPEQARTIYESGIAAAKRMNDRHALSELMAVYQALMGIEPDEDWD